jgi:hypothetical protein
MYNTGSQTTLVILTIAVAVVSVAIGYYLGHQSSTLEERR